MVFYNIYIVITVISWLSSIEFALLESLQVLFCRQRQNKNIIVIIIVLTIIKYIPTH